MWHIWGEDRFMQVLVGKRRPGRSRSRLEDNIKMDLKEIRCGRGLD
jgi:hypothetical protein